MQIRKFLNDNALISGHPEEGGGGGVTLRTYGGMSRDLATLFHNFKPGMKGLDCFCTFATASPGEDPRDL